MSHHIIEFDQKCKSCDGTGLYIGLAGIGIDGAGVVCHTCKGTGCKHIKIEYDDFEKRRRSRKVRRVYEVNPGIVIGEGDGLKLEDFGGMPYLDWLKRNTLPRFSENRRYTCPAWWYQSADYDKNPSWGECVLSGAFSSCKNFSKQNECWRRWDKEFSNNNGRLIDL